MSNKVRKAIVISLYIISLIILIFCIKVRLTPNIYLDTQVRLILLFIFCILVYINGYILVYKLNYSKKILKFNLILYFLILDYMELV